MDERIQVEVTINDGSQIIGFKKDKWEQLAIPIQSDYQRVMESENKTKGKTLGLL